MNLQEQIKVRNDILRLQLRIDSLNASYAELQKQFWELKARLSEVQVRSPGRPRKNG